MSLAHCDLSRKLGGPFFIRIRQTGHVLTYSIIWCGLNYKRRLLAYNLSQIGFHTIYE
jgi:hypothetical protein